MLAFSIPRVNSGTLRLPVVGVAVLDSDDVLLHARAAGWCRVDEAMWGRIYLSCKAWTEQIMLYGRAEFSPPFDIVRRVWGW